MQIARLMAERSTCLRRRVGAVIVRDRRILTTGYNGAPTGMRHCEEVGCLREKRNIPSGTMHELCRGLHAEQNAIIQAAMFGVSIKGAEIYCTNVPCIICAKMLINAGIGKRICYQDGYPDELALEMLQEASVQLVQIPFGKDEG
ncbi:MAG: cytidine/deoxycytidylate deaminase family protein [Candidatus Coatesbacteria bacterium]|nr:cytidine/deoxycytidylate deaminase family protein [Candidatus Coatesbacteria bacterium]